MEQKVICSLVRLPAEPANLSLTRGGGGLGPVVLQAEEAVAGEPPHHLAEPLALEEADLLRLLDGGFWEPDLGLAAPTRGS